MKLPIKDKYLQEIKNGAKNIEFRDAHLTLESIETSEVLRVEVKSVQMLDKNALPSKLQDSGMFEDDTVMAFNLKPILKEKDKE